MDDRSRNRILGVLFVGVLMGALDAAIVGPALPALQADFGVQERTLSWVFTIYVLCTLLSTPLMAKLADKAGRRSIYVLDVTLFGLGSLIVALSPNFPVLLIGRAIQGIGAGGIFPIASAVIGDTFPPEKRGRALGLIGAVFGLAFILGPILGGVLLRYSWHLLFYINLPIALAIIIAAFQVLPTTRPPEPQPFDWAGLGVLTLSLISLTLGLNQFDGSEIKLWPLALALLGGGLLPVFAAVEQRATDPIIRLKMFSSQQMLMASLLAIGSGMCMMSVSFLPSLITSSFQVKVSVASFMLIPLILTLMVGSPIVGHLVDRIGSKQLLLGGSILLIIGLLILSLVTLTLVNFYTAIVFIGLGLSALLGAPIRYIVMNATPSAERTAAQGATSVFSGIGQILCSALIGSIAGSFGGGTEGYQAGYLFVCSITVAMLAACLKLKDRSAEVEAFGTREAGAADIGG
ncbi:MAG: MFS transporter [Chlorobiales bacterium]|nr:MFS transporter [Chlorobiales bacterium]